MRGLFLGLFSLMFPIPAIFAAASQGVVRPVDLRCEYRTNPMGVDALAPRLSWKLEAADPTARELSQSAFQVLVASSETLLLRDQGDLWDSGKVGTDKSIQIPYAGKPLSSGELVWWKVRVWDNQANPSAWSGPARWSMGLLAASDWKGKWIGLDSGAGKPRELAGAQWIGAGNSTSGTVYLRGTFEVSPDNPVSDALLFMVGSGATVLSINGEQAGKSDGVKDPLSSDISGSVHTGKNTLAASVTSTGKDAAALIAAIELDLADGSRMMVHTGEQWRVSATEAPDWNTGSFNDSSWAATKVLGTDGMAPWGEVGSRSTGYLQQHWPADSGKSPWGEVGYGWRTVLPARLLRKDFSAPAPVKRATLYISGLGLFEAYLNGERVGHDVLAPALSEYDKRVFYMTYDVTKLVRAGSNAIGVMLGNGRFFAPRYNIPTATRSFGYPKLLLQLEMETADGKVERVCSDETWKLTADGPIRANNEYDGEFYDARKEMKGWSRPRFAATDWQQAQVVEGPPGVLSAQPIGPTRVTETLKPVSVHEVRPGIYVFDMSQNMAGWCRLTVAGPRGSQVTLRHAERLRPDGMLYTDNLRSAEVTDTYILKGNGTEVYEPRFTYHGFRYVEVKGFPGKPTLAALEGREVHDDLDHVSEFATSNPLLNQIYKAVLWGAKDNYHSIPTDCPQRDERQGWLGDRSGESLGETYMFDLAAFYANWVQDIGDAQDAEGRISDVSPAYWPLYSDNATWPASFIMVPDHLYEQYGDERVIEQNYPGMRKWVKHMETYLKNDLMPRDIYGDWCVPPESPALIHSNDPSRKTDGAVLGTTYFYRLLRLMTNYATILGKQDDAGEYSQLAGKLLAAFNKTYFQAATSQYSNGSATSSVLPLAFGMVPEEDRQSVADALIRKIADQSKNHVSTGLIGGQWLMQALSDYSYAGVAYQIATQPDYPGWGYMVNHGATTIWELWNGDTANPAMNSGNHLMLVGDLITWSYQNLAGIRTDRTHPAFKHIVMRPTPVGDLTYVKASYDSSYGKIVSDWKIAAGRFIWNLTVPPNSTATVYVPAKGESGVTESAKPASEAHGVKFLRTEAGATVYEIGSGSYQFESATPR
jgi:alpha-L-rhamnosidase